MANLRRRELHSIDSNQLLAGVPLGLRDPLVEEFKSLSTAYLQGRWKYTSLDAGRFCEIVYCIIDGATSGTYLLSPTKPHNFPHSCRAIESRPPVSIGDHSLRILMPRVLLGIYDVRNNRNVGHVGGDVVANRMDAELVHTTSKWILAEFVRVFHNVPISEAQRIVDGLVERDLPLVWETDGVKRVLRPESSASDKSLILLYVQTTWVRVTDLCSWTKYSNISVYRNKVLAPLDEKMMVEFDQSRDAVIITPLGISHVEKKLLPSAANS